MKKDREKNNGGKRHRERQRQNVPSLIDDLLHIEDGEAELLAVGAGGPELKHSKSRTRTNCS